MEKKKMDPRVIKYFLLAALLILAIRYFDIILGGAVNLWGIAAPLILGCIIAYVLNIVLKFLEKHFFPKSQNKRVIKLRRPVCIVLSIVLIVAVFTLVTVLVVPEFVKAIGVIGKSIPVLVEGSIDWITEHENIFPAIAGRLEELQVDWEGLGNSALNYLKTGLGGVLNSTVSIVSSMVGGVANFVIGLIFAVYILANKEKLANQFKKLIHAYGSPKWIAAGKRILMTADETFSSFIIGQVTEAVILGTLCTIGMFIFRFPYAPMIGAFVGVTALIPIVGAYLGAIVGVIMIFTQDPLKALLFIVFIIVLQQLEGNLIYPKVVGSSIGLPGMWVLAAVTVGGGLLGISGMLLGVPTAATVYKLLAYGVKQKAEVQKPEMQKPEMQKADQIKAQQNPMQQGKEKKHVKSNHGQTQHPKV